MCSSHGVLLAVKLGFMFSLSQSHLLLSSISWMSTLSTLSTLQADSKSRKAFVSVSCSCSLPTNQTAQAVCLGTDPNSLVPKASISTKDGTTGSK